MERRREPRSSRRRDPRAVPQPATWAIERPSAARLRLRRRSHYLPACSEDRLPGEGPQYLDSSVGHGLQVGSPVWSRGSSGVRSLPWLRAALRGCVIR